jgi:signal transduction histidine kinase
VRVAGTPLRDRTGALIGVVCTLEDLSGRRLAELDLRRADQMQVVGGLAAGIAHEINTPIQFIGDTVSFLGDAFADLGRVLEAARALRRELEARGDAGQLALPLAELEAECDVEFLRAEIPGAVERAADGVRRVSRIVRALKEFAHPGGVEKAPANLAAAVETTLAVAKNEYKHVADVELALETLPPVECHLGDVNQVLLNLIVNAAHAIEARAGKGRGRGHIRIAARRAGDDVVISVADDGCGIPEEIRARVFEPFFTTKAAGKGTGQGLALAQRIVVERHGGCLWFESERGRGTTFHLSLPIRSGRGARAA